MGSKRTSLSFCSQGVGKIDYTSRAAASPGSIQTIASHMTEKKKHMQNVPEENPVRTIAPTLSQICTCSGSVDFDSSASNSPKQQLTSSKNESILWVIEVYKDVQWTRKYLVTHRTAKLLIANPSSARRRGPDSTGGDAE